MAKHNHPAEASKPIPLLLTEPLLSLIREVSGKTGLTQADIMRLCIRAGVKKMLTPGFELFALTDAELAASIEQLPATPAAPARTPRKAARPIPPGSGRTGPPLQ